MSNMDLETQAEKALAALSPSMVLSFGEQASGVLLATKRNLLTSGNLKILSEHLRSTMKEQMNVTWSCLCLLITLSLNVHFQRKL
jgi:hypothetical protein